MLTASLLEDQSRHNHTGVLYSTVEGFMTETHRCRAVHHHSLPSIRPRKRTQVVQYSGSRQHRGYIFFGSRVFVDEKISRCRQSD